MFFTVLYRHLDILTWMFSLLFLSSCPQVSVVSRACSDFLIGTMDLCNCLSLFSLAEAYGSASLLRSANEFVVQNFSDLSKTEDFLDMQVLLKNGQKNVILSEKLRFI